MNIRRKHALFLGIVGNVLYMIGDWLIDAFGPGNVEVGLLGESNWVSMPMWRFDASLLLGAAASVLMIIYSHTSTSNHICFLKDCYLIILLPNPNSSSQNNPTATSSWVVFTILRVIPAFYSILGARFGLCYATYRCTVYRCPTLGGVAFLLAFPFSS